MGLSRLRRAAWLFAFAVAVPMLTAGLPWQLFVPGVLACCYAGAWISEHLGER